MSTLRNHVQLLGRLGVDPKSVAFGDNKKLVKFSLATKDFFRDKDGERKEETQWHNIVLYGKSAETAEKYLKKGREVAIAGKISYRSWEDKEGNTKYITEIVADEIQFIGPKET